MNDGDIGIEKGGVGSRPRAARLGESLLDADSSLSFEHRRYRRRVALTVVPGSLGLIAVLVAIVFEYIAMGMGGLLLELPSYLVVQVLAIAGVIGLVLSGFGAVMMYLQTGFKGFQKVDLEYQRSGDFRRFLRDLEERINSLESRETAPRSELGEKAVNELVAELRMAIEQQATREFLDEIKASILLEKGRTQQLESVLHLEDTKSRLLDELQVLTRRGHTNLSIGIFVAVGGVALLIIFVFGVTGGEAGGMEFLRRFLPQISLVTIVEIFAYFFLRLYSVGLTEIKYFQNEITNVEARMIAVESAIQFGDSELMRRVILELVETERNHVLKEGETTASFERRRAEKDPGTLFGKGASGLWKRE